MPKPTEPEFDTSFTTLLRLNAESAVGNELEASDIAPLPEWVKERTSITSTEHPFMSLKMPFKQWGLLMRSTSGWPRYVADHPEEKALEKDFKDLSFRMLDKWRREEAEMTGQKMVEWDDVVDVSVDMLSTDCRRQRLTMHSTVHYPYGVPFCQEASLRRGGHLTRFRHWIDEIIDCEALAISHPRYQ